MSRLERMRAGELYQASDPEVRALYVRAQERVRADPNAVVAIA